MSKETLEQLAQYWNRAVGERRETWFVAALALSSLISQLPFAREVSISNFFIYALLPIILVLANREKFRQAADPCGIDILLSVTMIIGSFVFNYFTGIVTDDYTYGLTDYVILVAGIVSLFYSLKSKLTQLGIVLLVTLRMMTLGLNIVYSTALVSISNFFVTVVVSISKLLISDEIRSGYLPGEIIVGGEAGSATVGIGWACAGLEELALISLILLVLITSFEMTRTASVLWVSLGIAGSFLVNIARMVLLVWVAYSYGIEPMLWVHTHLGDVLFLVWIVLFWVMFFRFASPRNSTYSANDQGR